jgi:7-carboxy-7-deazaguanine synthase
MITPDTSRSTDTPVGSTIDAPAPLRVAELFGPTFQGEGPSMGQRAVFVRLSGCNLTCGWCDTPYTWDWTRFDQADQVQVMTLESVLRWVLDQDSDLVVVTGGEPLIQQHRLLPLTTALTDAGRRVEIETNGTIAPTPALTTLVHQFNVSPKLPGSGVPVTLALREPALVVLAATGKAVFKFVLATPADTSALVALQRRLGLTDVWVMPEGTTEDAVISGARDLVEPALVHGWHLSLRLQVLLWGDHRGR